MANKVSNFSDLIQRVAASCLLHPLARGNERGEDLENPSDKEGENEDFEVHQEFDNEEETEEEEEEDKEKFGVLGEKEKESSERVMELESMMGEVFDAVSALKRAYMSLQEAHCPWDPDKMRLTDVEVVAELRKLGRLKERFRRRSGRRGRSGLSAAAAPLREVVAPYEAAVEELKREVKAKDVEVVNLKEKLRHFTASRKKGMFQSKRKVNSSQVAAAPSPELFEAMTSQVKETSKSFTSLLLSLMRSANWDIGAAVRSIEAATAATANDTTTTTTSIAGPHHAKYALESYVCRKAFQGFDHETFYMDGSLSSLLHPDQFRRDCFTQYRDMKAMDPVEILGILPTCQFGKFCSKKFLSIVHPKMEESLFGDLEQRRLVLAGNHPRTQFYGEFLGMAKSIWLLHLLAFSMEPSPSHFEASRGADFHPQYMESVVRFSAGRVPAGHIVGFPVTPGFKLGNGTVIKARVYLASRP